MSFDWGELRSEVESVPEEKMAVADVGTASAA